KEELILNDTLDRVAQQPAFISIKEIVKNRGLGMSTIYKHVTRIQITLQTKIKKKFPDYSGTFPLMVAILSHPQVRRPAPPAARATGSEPSWREIIKVDTKAVTQRIREAFK